MGGLILALGLAVLPSSPASASAYACRSPNYVTTEWNAGVCLTTDGYTFVGDGEQSKRPGTCDYWRVYLVNNSLTEVWSSGKLSCGNRFGEVIANARDSVKFPNGVAKARVKAWNGNTVILSIDSPWLHYAS
ncbi:hypothetical protein [Plantactinospora sp. GCM10030261]|uniref:hypothetical protein n=1 Tax=Plantactinospora sp. GCM10030261 TaxID=3273420 RepID=UPI00360C8104